MTPLSGISTPPVGQQSPVVPLQQPASRSDNDGDNDSSRVANTPPTSSNRALDIYA
jgi:hypothetical protein